ncbi:Chitin-binding domain protein [Dirofilaria immitis]
MNLQHLTLLLVLIVLICRYVICTEMDRKQHSEFSDGNTLYACVEYSTSVVFQSDKIIQYTGGDHLGSYNTMKKRLTAEYQGHRSREVDQLGIEEEVNIVLRPSNHQASKLITSGDIPDDINKYDLADTVKISDSKKIRQLIYKPIWNKRIARSYDNIRLRNLHGDKRWDGEIRQYEEESKNILAANKGRERYPSENEGIIDPLTCIGWEDGVYEAGPCENWYILCRSDNAKKIFCDDGLYWNGDKNRCEPEADIIYCRLKFDCTGLDDGVYVDGCSNVFWFCNSETASLSKCPKDLYFNIKKLRCDVKEMISACGGVGQDEMKFIKKSSRKSKQQVTHKTLKPHRKQGICEKRENGKYAIRECYGKFVFCIDGRSMVVNCHDGELYSPEHQQCTDAGNLPLCKNFTDAETTTTTPGYSVSCSSLPDGIYALGDCERNFSICFNGVGSNASCGSGLVYNGKTGYCDHESNVEKCAQFKKDGPESHESVLTHTDAGVIHKVTGTYRKHNVCRKRENGMYAMAKCYGKYLFCIGGRGLVVICNRGQLFSPEHHQCMDAAELPSCADFTDLETAKNRHSIPCSSLSDGVYELGDCERNFLICFSGEGSIASCGPNLVYNVQTGNCEQKSKVEKCLKYRRWNKSSVSHEDADCRCKGQKDGLYAVGCTEKFYSCSNGISVGLECPADLVFNVDNGFCDYRKNVIACNGHQSMISNEIDAVGEGTASNLVSGCSILEDGIYGLSPCGSGYYHCWHGATSFAKCAYGLVFNPSLKRCDFRENVLGCRQYKDIPDKIQKPINGSEIISIKGDMSRCQNLSDGFYVDGCSRIYYGCANGGTFFMNCPWNLAFDSHSGTCEEPDNVEACRYTSNEEMYLSLFDSNKSPMSSCTIQPNGPHQLELCSANYISCQDGMINLVSCPEPLIFNPDNSQCVFRSDVVACERIRQSTPNKLDVQCDARPDGIFPYNCSKYFYICVKGKTYLFTCPDGMAYDSKFHRCRNSAEVQACIQTLSSTTPLSQTPLHNLLDGMPKDDNKFCDNRHGGNYAAGPCLRVFFSCVHTRKVLMLCPPKLVFDASTNQCEYPNNVVECQNHPSESEDVSAERQDAAEQLISSTIKSFCKGRKNGIYSLNSCLRSYLQCYNQKGTVKYCPENMVFDRSVGACTPEEMCNSIMTSPQIFFSTTSGYVGNDENENVKSTEEATKYSLPGCYELADGDYSTGCVTDFITCINGSGIHKKCLNSTVFSNILRRCVDYDQCAFLMYRALASFYPSDRVLRNEWVKHRSAMVAPSVFHSKLSLPKTSNSVGENCKYARAHCISTSNENAINTPVSDGDTSSCEYAKMQCINEANEEINQIPTESHQEATRLHSGKGYQNQLCLPEISEKRVDSVRCDSMDDGLYAFDCSDQVVVCSFGWKKIYGCPKGQLFIPARLGCDEYWKCTKTNPCKSGYVGVIYLGKVRSIPSTRPLSIGGFSCVNKEDGNYGRQCSPIYIKCVQQRAILMRCHPGRLFNQISGHCISLNHCPIFSTIVEIGKVQCVENERFGIDICNDYYYTCSNGKLVPNKCPPGHSFDIVHGVCRTKCDLCGCEDDIRTNTPICNPGEIIPFGPCEITYAECSAQRIFELRHCMKNKRFDLASRICRFWYEIAECFQNPVKESGDIAVPALHQIYDSFKHPLQLHPYLKPNEHDRNPYKLGSLHIQPAKTASYNHPYMNFGMLQNPSSSIFIPHIAQQQQQQHVSNVFDNSVNSLRTVQDTFRVSPSLYASIPNMQTLAVLDQFRLPGFSASPTSSYNTAVASTSDADSLEGSGEGENAPRVGSSRVKRNVPFEAKLPDTETELEAGLEMKLDTELEMKFKDGYLISEIQDLCLSKTNPANIALGFCRSNYIFCKTKENTASLAKCKNGDLFDSRLEKCVPAMDCILNKPFHQNDTNESTPCALLSDGTYALPGCSQHFLSCVAKKAFLRSCTNGLYYDGNKQQCDYKERIALCNNRNMTSEQSLSSIKGHPNSRKAVGEAKTVLGNVAHEVSSTSSNFTCSVDSTVSLECSPSFVICAEDIAYVFSCDDDLVFDEIAGSCNRIEDTPKCGEEYNQQRVISKILGFNSSPSLKGVDDLPHTLVNLTKISNEVSSFDCFNARDGLRSPQCSPFFFVCSAGQLTGFVCQNASVFNLEAGFCDEKKYVSSCNRAHLFHSSFTSSVTQEIPLKPSFTTIQPSHHSTPRKQWECKKGFSGIISASCSRKFILCIYGIDHVFFCQHGLVYNINTDRCDHPQNVAACSDESRTTFRKRHEASHFDKDSVSSIRVVDLRANGLSNDTMQARCQASEGQTATYGHCREDYISCQKDGTLHKSYCTNSYLFDEVVGRCVPAEICGAVVPESISLAKGECDGIEDGVSKGIGPCLSQYYVCKKGVPIRRRCFKRLETFSAAAGGCVTRSRNPECLQKLTALSDRTKKSNNMEDFCIRRPDGLYRHPTDCARVLQCFGEEVFEHLPCNDGLVFNEISGGCDYKSNVPECIDSSAESEKGWNSSSKGSNCEGKIHGDFLADENDCSVYYRCVWGKLEKFFCPDHTVFNPILSKMIAKIIDNTDEFSFNSKFKGI